MRISDWSSDVCSSDLDLAERLPGRGLWLRARQDMMMKACARNLFAKAAKRHVRVPEDLAVQVERLALRRCLDLLGLARCAGAVVAGWEDVRAAWRAGGVGVPVRVAGGGGHGRQKIQALACGVGPTVTLVQLYRSGQWGEGGGTADRA